ncbi:hypothetical protein BpHYR1_053024, partial [Brachionus plicatilis]
KANELPGFVFDIKTPDGLVLAADHKPNQVHELEGDVDALNLVDLESEGLSHYKNYLQKFSFGNASSNISRSISAAQMNSSHTSSFSSLSSRSKKTASNAPVNNSVYLPSASFVFQKAPSVNAEKAASIFSGKAPSVRSERNFFNNSEIPASILSEKAFSLRSEKAASIQASVRTQSRASQRSVARSIPIETENSSEINVPASNLIQENPRLSQRSILKSASVVAQQPSSFSTSIKFENPTRSRASGFSFSTASGTKLPTLSTSSSISSLIEKIFRSIDKNNKGTISVEDAEKILLRLNSRLGRRYGEDDVKVLFATLDVNNDGSLDLEEFKRAFLNLAN